jgi:hypothetical protein
LATFSDSLNEWPSFGLFNDISSSRDWTKEFSFSWWCSYGVSSSVNGRSSIKLISGDVFIGIWSTGNSAGGISSSSSWRWALK